MLATRSDLTVTLSPRLQSALLAVRAAQAYDVTRLRARRAPRTAPEPGGAGRLS